MTTAVLIKNRLVGLSNRTLLFISQASLNKRRNSIDTITLLSASAFAFASIFRSSLIDRSWYDARIVHRFSTHFAVVVPHPFSQWTPPLMVVATSLYIQLLDWLRPQIQSMRFVEVMQMRRVAPRCCQVIMHMSAFDMHLSVSQYLSTYICYRPRYNMRCYPYIQSDDRDLHFDRCK